MCHSGQTKARERKASLGCCAVRGSCGEEVVTLVLGVERTLSPGEVQAFAAETSRGFGVGVLFQGSELHIKACTREFGGCTQFTEIPLSSLPFLSNMHRHNQA